jgi:hypothetical protein
MCQPKGLYISPLYMGIKKANRNRDVGFLTFKAQAGKIVSNAPKILIKLF